MGLQHGGLQVLGVPAQLTVSLGVTVLFEDDPDDSAVLRRADEAVYEAKHRGRNQVVVLTENAPSTL